MTQPIVSNFRSITSKDLDKIMEIEKACFDRRWTHRNFSDCLASRSCRGQALYVGTTIVGFVIYEQFKTRLDIVSIAIHPSWQRKGLGRRIVLRLIQKLDETGRTGLAAVVRESNLTAQLFYRAVGLKSVKVLHGYYSDLSEDGYMFCWGDIKPDEVELYTASED